MDSSIEQIARALDAFLRPEQDARQARKRERILAAATAQFIQHGYRKASMDAVAREAGVAKGTVYLYYRNKAELLFHAMTREKARYLERLRPLDATIEPAERLHRFITIGLVMSRSMPLVTRMIGGDHEFLLAMEEVDVALMERVNRLQMAITRDLLRAAGGADLPEAELARRTRVLIDLMYAVTTSGPMLRSQALPPEEYARTLADVIVGGILAPVGAPPAGDGLPVPSDDSADAAADRAAGVPSLARSPARLDETDAKR